MARIFEIGKLINDKSSKAPPRLLIKVLVLSSDSSNGHNSKTWSQQIQQKTLKRFVSTIRNNEDYIPNYGERYFCDEPISTAFVKSAINHIISKRFVKNSKCVGQNGELICYFKCEPKSWMVICRHFSSNGILSWRSMKSTSNLIKSPSPHFCVDSSLRRSPHKAIIYLLHCAVISS